MRRRLLFVLGAIGCFLLGVGLQVATSDDADESEVAAEFEFADTTTTTSTTVPPPRTARLAFTGDLLPHTPVQRAGAAAAEEGWDFVPMFAEVQPIIEGVDLALCHLETPISIDDTNLTGYPQFNAPRAFAEAARDVGFDGCSLASNHSYDRRAQGAIDTITVMEEIGLPFVGQARNEREDITPVLYDANGIMVAHLSATFSLNGFRLPSDQQYLVDLIDPDDLIEEAWVARSAGAEFVVVSLHWGAEYRHEPVQSQVDWLEEILPSDAIDLVIGHHAHVVQPVDKLGDEWVVYGVGNFLSNQSANCCVAASQDGMIATVELFETAPGEIEAVGVHYIPTWVDRGNGYVIRVADPDRTDLSDSINAQMGITYDRTFDVVSSRLGEADGLTIGVGLEPGAPSVIPTAAPTDDE